MQERAFFKFFFSGKDLSEQKSMLVMMVEQLDNLSWLIWEIIASWNSDGKIVEVDGNSSLSDKAVDATIDAVHRLTHLITKASLSQPRQRPERGWFEEGAIIPIICVFDERWREHYFWK